LKVHLLDGTYELFRHFYAMPKQTDRDGHEVAAIVGVLGSVLGMLEGGASHLGVATDHVIESFRNDLWPGYKTSEGIDPELLAQNASPVIASFGCPPQREQRDEACMERPATGRHEPKGHPRACRGIPPMGFPVCPVGARRLPVPCCALSALSASRRARPWGVPVRGAARLDRIGGQSRARAVVSQAGDARDDVTCFRM
jgi:hypothetical protein